METSGTGSPARPHSLRGFFHSEQTLGEAMTLRLLRRLLARVLRGVASVFLAIAYAFAGLSVAVLPPESKLEMRNRSKSRH